MTTKNAESTGKAASPPLAALDGSASRFRQELEKLINSNNQEAGSDTPDFILADYLTDCLAAFDRAVTRRAWWYGHKTRPVPCDPPFEPNKKVSDE